MHGTGLERNEGKEKKSHLISDPGPGLGFGPLGAVISVRGAGWDGMGWGGVRGGHAKTEN